MTNVRLILRNEVRKATDPVAVATSGGIDSSALVVSLLDEGLKPVVTSFTLDNKDSTDFLSATRLAKKFDLEFLPIRLSTNAYKIAQDVIRLVRDYGVRKKTGIECLVPFLKMLDVLQSEGIQTLVVGSAADGHFGLSKKAMIHFREPVETFQNFRQDYFEQVDPAQTSTLARIGNDYGVVVLAPYLSQELFNLFSSSTWNDLNKPRQKEVIRREFPELDSLRIKNHSNLQLGDSGIAETIGNAIQSIYAPNAKSPVTAYNKLAKLYG